jgi:uncharacterized protein (DUF1800 family)
LGGERRVEWCRGDVRPVEAEAEETHALVAVGAAEDVRDPLGVARGEADDVEAAEEGRDVLREPLPREDAEDDEPEDLEALLLHELALAAVQDVEQVDVDEVGRVQHRRRVDEHAAEQAGVAVPDQLRREQREDGVPGLRDRQPPFGETSISLDSR